MEREEAMHLARLAALDMVLHALMRDAKGVPFDAPDGLTVSFSDDGTDITYTRSGLPIGGEGM